VSILTDNIGRKKGMLISYGICISGMVLCGFGSNLYMIGIGLFLMGFGSDSAINICFYFITETVETKSRQKYSVFIQLFFCVGGLATVGYFYFLTNWRLILWIFIFIPSIIC
jgi:MFS family permease